MSDLISRQAAIDALAEQMPTPYTPDGSHPADEGIFAAQEIYADCIETIKLLPSAQPEQKIYRSMSEEEFEAWLYNHGICHPDIHESIACDIVPSLIDDAINELPPAPPEYVTGFWLIRRWGDDAKCSNCGHTFKDVYDMDNHDRFCRFCGSKMEGIETIK